MSADYPNPGDVIGFRKRDGSMGITTFSSKAESTVEHILWAAVEEVVAIFRTVPDRERAMRQAESCLSKAIVVAAMIEVRAGA